MKFIHFECRISADIFYGDGRVVILIVEQSNSDTGSEGVLYPRGTQAGASASATFRITIDISI